MNKTVQTGRPAVVLRDPERKRWLTIATPTKVLIADSPEEVPALLATIEDEVNRHHRFAAGFITYEAAPAFDEALKCQQHDKSLPAAMFWLADEPGFSDSLPDTIYGENDSVDWNLHPDAGTYRTRIDAIKQQIELGNTYQVNYTVRQVTDSAGDAWRLFLDIAADAPYAAYFSHDDFGIVSASPELFFAMDGRDLVCRPMKGTRKRGLTSREDESIAGELRNATKDRAENVMITDMIRNDLGRIADAGSVRVESLFDLEKYPTVWQMTSTVRATSTASFSEIFSALFPCASVTGAPKAASMKLIAELEESPRGVFTGAIGWLAPERQSRFSVAIRTATINTTRGSGVYGVGGGIVWDSDATEEYDECLAKSAILKSSGWPQKFEILETLRWSVPEGYFLCDLHLDRMAGSAGYFGFRFERSRAERLLDELAAGFGNEARRVRLLLSEDGRMVTESSRLPPTPDAAITLRLATGPVDTENPFLYHKTTHRRVYEKAQARVPDADDVLLWNPDGFVTESSIANLIVRFGDAEYTPPVESGLLAGTLREELLKTGELIERAIRVDELATADEIALINSVRGRYAARLLR